MTCLIRLFLCSALLPGLSGVSLAGTPEDELIEIEAMIEAQGFELAYKQLKPFLVKHSENERALRDLAAVCEALKKYQEALDHVSKWVEVARRDNKRRKEMLRWRGQLRVKLANAANEERSGSRPTSAQGNDHVEGGGVRSRAAGKKFKNSIGMELVLVPAGEFLMGSSQGDEDEQPVHRVRISKAFYMGKYEVTQSQYEAVMGANPSSYKGADRASHPVEKVSWKNAVEFCLRLSQKEKKTYRLPTEAEWEYACRAGTQTKYGFGAREADLADYAWYGNNSESKTHPVGLKKPNAWGLYDMHGNVWEWCSDWYGEYPRGNVTDPAGAQSGEGRVRRGGGWGNSARGCRSANRYGGRPGDRLNGLGFRLALLSQRSLR